MRTRFDARERAALALWEAMTSVADRPVPGSRGMSPTAAQTEQFAAARPRLLRLAYSQLGDLGEAEDVVQDAWLRLERADAGAIEDLDGWLTTVVARLALDALRSARAGGSATSARGCPSRSSPPWPRRPRRPTRRTASRSTSR